jgi:hypothetical protein
MFTLTVGDEELLTCNFRTLRTVIWSFHDVCYVEVMNLSHGTQKLILVSNLTFVQYSTKRWISKDYF